MDPTTSLPAVSTQSSQCNGERFILRFSPDEVLAAVVREKDKTITVLDLKSGIPRIIIDTGVEVYGLGVNRSNIVAISEGKIVTWGLPAGDHALDLRANITDSVLAATLDRDFPGIFPPPQIISMSPGLHRFGVVWYPDERPRHTCLCLYDVHTGQHLQTVTKDLFFHLRSLVHSRRVWSLM